MHRSLQLKTLERIHIALEAARSLFTRFTSGAIETEYKVKNDPVTEADRAIDKILHQHLVRDGEGWLSEESMDDFTRLNKDRTWVVDPLDGTREFVAGIPEFCISVAMVEENKPVAGGIYNPATRQLFLGSLDTGVTCNGTRAWTSQRKNLRGATVLASRSEVKRGEWMKFSDAPFKIQPMGSVAYKLALISAGIADATFTLTPKNEWDVAAGVALIESAGGFVRTLDGNALRFNNRDPLLSGLMAGGPLLKNELVRLISANLPPETVSKGRPVQLGTTSRRS